MENTKPTFVAKNAQYGAKSGLISPDPAENGFLNNTKLDTIRAEQAGKRRKGRGNYQRIIDIIGNFDE